MRGPLTHCVIVRPNLGAGLLAAMVIHAAGESSPGNLPDTTHALALQARTVDELEAAVQLIRARGLRCVEVREPDAPWNGALMAIGIEPVERARLRFLQHLPLVRSCPSSSAKEQQVPNLQVAGSSPASGSIPLGGCLA